MIRYVILAEGHDAGAHGVAALLAARHGAGEVLVATGADLVFLARSAYRADASRVGVEVALADGRRLGDGPGAVILCRIGTAVAPWSSLAADADAHYAASEAVAWLAAWLQAMGCPVLNAPTGDSLPGPALSATRWLMLAAAAGVPCLTQRMTTNGRAHGRRGHVAQRLEDGAEPGAVPIGRRPARYLEPHDPVGPVGLVVGSRVVGDVPDALHDGCRALARVGGCEVLELRFARAERGPVLAAVDAVPGLYRPGEVEAVAGRMEELVAA